MLTQDQLFQLCQHLGLSRAAQTVIEEIRSSPPVRRVRSTAGNVSVRYPSRKMGFTIQAESHKNELAGVYEKEHDPDTLEYYDQPSRIKLEYQSKNGRSIGVMHTPDFFVIRTDCVGWEEWKTEEELIQLADKMPHRYARDEEGRWRCPPGERYAAPLGFFYKVRSSAEIDWVFQRNIRFLEDYLRDDCPEMSEAVATEITALVKAKPGITLDELLRYMGETHSDDIYRLVAMERIYIDIHLAPLAEPTQVRIFGNEETARAYSVMSEAATYTAVMSPRAVDVTVGATILWDHQPWLIANVGEAKVWLGTQEGTFIEVSKSVFEAMVKQGKITGVEQEGQVGMSAEAQEILAQAHPDDLKEANRRYQIIEPMRSRRPATDETVPERTRYAWLARYREAEQIYGCGYAGLIPRWRQRGNRERKLPLETLALLEAFIANEYETHKQKSKREVYGELVRACEANHLLAPSYLTFAKAVNRRPRHEQTEKRQGHRAAYPHEPLYLELTLTTPRHGDRPFEIGHIDHTQLDIELLCSRTDRNLGRPWATYLVDAFTRRLLAVYLTYDPPSYRSNMMILRECVRRHGRLPQVVVVDGGRDFESTYFETLLARYECTKKTRPAAKPRFGSVCERLFGTSNTTFVHNLTGNTQIMRNVRQVTKSVDPKQHARWSLGRLYVRLCEWAYEVYDTIDHPALGQSPREAFAMGLAQGGQRSHRLIPFDEDFRMFTLPTTRKGTALVQPNDGVKIHSIYYWSDAFRDPEVEKTSVPVRYDPWDAGTAYAFVKGRWVNCVSEYYAYFKGRSEQEMMLATTELRKRNMRHGRQFTVTARRLAEFVVSLEAEEALLEQRLRDAEGRQVLMMTQDKQTHEDALATLAVGPVVNECNDDGETAEYKPVQDIPVDLDRLTVYGDF